MEGLENWHDLLDEDRLHPLCAIFPPMTEEEYEGLVGSMRTNGFLESDPVALTRDENDRVLVLDGRNRLTAAADAGVTPKFFFLPDGQDAYRFVVARNVERRMLTPGQRAAVGSRLATLQPGVVPSENQPGTTQEEAAVITGASVSGIKKYRQIAEADPEVAALVEQGKMSLNQGLMKVQADSKPPTPDPTPPPAATDSEVDSPPRQEEVPPSLQPDEKPAGSLDMSFEEDERKIDYTARMDIGLGKVVVQMGTEEYFLRPDTATQLAMLILEAVGNGE